MKILSRMLLTAICGALLVACGGSGGDEEPLTTDVPAATAIPDNFDPEVLSGMVVQPSEVTGFATPPAATWSPPVPGVQAFSFFYGDDNFRFQTTVGRYASPELLASGLERIRVGLSTLTGGERNGDLPGSDLDFVYQITSIPATYMLATKGTFFIQTGFSARNQSQKERVLDTGTLQRYHAFALAHITAYLADPASVSPAPGAPPYPYRTPSASTPTPDAGTPAP